MRILKGYSKDEQKELEDAKRKYMNGGDLLRDITSSLPDMRFGLIWRKYDKANPDKQSSIINDILDFYNNKAKFKEPKKYYVHLIKGDRSSYLNITWDGSAKLANNFSVSGWQNKFTRDEVYDIDSRFVPFMEEVDVDDE